MRAKFRSNIKLNKTANLPSDPQFMIHIANLTEAAIVASKHYWDTLAYFSAEHSVTPEPGYVEDVVKEEQHNVMTATNKVSNDFKYCIVSMSSHQPGTSCPSSSCAGTNRHTGITLQEGKGSIVYL